MGGLLGLLTGRWSFFRSRDKREAPALEDAHADLDRWEAHVRENLSGGSIPAR